MMNRVGMIQMTSRSDPQENLAWIDSHTKLLAEQGAQWIVTPENALIFGDRTGYQKYAEILGEGPLQKSLANIAQQYGVWLIVGSFPIRREHGISTTLLVWNSDGELMSHYDKLHMFDVDVPDGHRHYRESDIFTAGDEVQIVSTPFGVMGLSICYDIRFPHLYSELRRQGADIILVPAAFTAVTGKAHWETLIRARAIETQCWVVAVNQTGTHTNGRETWGHSMVVSPWGEIVAQLSEGAEDLLVDIHLEQIQQVRQPMPVFEHARFHNQFLGKKNKL